MLAVNDASITDAQGEHDDWIEVYNAGTDPVDLGGFYFTDDLNEPTLWQVPNNDPAATTVPAGGFLIFWADKDTDQGANHLDFKLSGGGEDVAIYMPNGTNLVDGITYAELASDISFGRTTDGGNNLQVFANPTPNASNETVTGPPSYTDEITYCVIEGKDDAKEIFGTASYGSSTLLFEENAAAGIRFDQFDIFPGATIKTAYLQLSSEQGGTGACNLIIYGEATDHSINFDQGNPNVSDRATTQAQVSWNLPEWGSANERTDAQKTPELKALLQEIIDRPGWEGGNAITLLLKDISGSGSREAQAFDFNEAQNIPKLFVEVEYLVPQAPISNIYINEVVANSSERVDELGSFEDWIEIYNDNDFEVEIGGLYFTDEQANPAQWQLSYPFTIPAKGFFTVWADGRPEEGEAHANFKLSDNGENLAIYQLIGNEFVLIDAKATPEIPFKASFGRVTDGAAEWVLFGEVTPDLSNDGAELYLAPPSISLTSGIFTTSQTVTLTHPDPAAIIRFTLDGSEPTASAPTYTSEISIDNSVSIRAKAFKTGHRTSQIAVESYLFNVSNTLPIVHITTDPDNFFSDETGMYVEGTNGITGYCDDVNPRNYCQDWERPIHISLFEPDGTEVFSKSAGASISGACSRNNPMKSLNIYFRNGTYGSKGFDYPLFGDRGNNEYSRLKLRNSGNDYVRTMIRDGLIQSMLFDKVDIDLQAYRPAVMYLNGEYWGIHNLRDHLSADYVERLHGYDKYEIDMLKNPGVGWQEIKDGDDVHYNALADFLENNDLSVAANYNQAADQIEINEFLNYQISEVYISNFDWPGNNVIAWRPRTESGKWRYVLFDTDISSNNQFWFFEFVAPSFNTLAHATEPNYSGWPNDKQSTLFFRKLLENETFRNEYIQRTCSYIELVFNEDRVNHFTDSISNLINAEIPAHIDRWVDDSVPFQYRTSGGEYPKWLNNLAEFKTFFVERPDYMRGFINDHFTLDGTYQLSVDFDATSGGKVFVNSNKMDLPYDFEGTYFKNVPLRLTAEANPGYEFSHWLETGETNPEIDYLANANAILTPIFKLAIDLGGDQVACTGDAILLDATNSFCPSCTYEWEDASVNPQREVNPTVTTSYSVTITDANGITGVDMMEVSVVPSPDYSYDSEDVSCHNYADGSIDVSVSGGGGNFQFLWSNNATTEDLTNLSGGTFTVSITDGNGCVLVEEIELAEPDELDLMEVVDNVSCFGGTDGMISITPTGGTGSYSYNWGIGETTSVIGDLTSGAYLLEVTDADNCVTNTSVFVDQPEAISVDVSLQIPTTTTAGGIFVNAIQGGTPPFQTSLNDGQIPLPFTDLDPGNYTLTIVDANDCLYTEEIDLSIVNSVLGIDDLSNFKMIPNPSNGAFVLQLDFDATNTGIVYIYNSLGQRLRSWNFNGQNLQKAFDLSEVADGIYWVVIQTKAGSATQRLMIGK